MTRLPLVVSAVVAAVVVSAHGQQTQQPPVRPDDEQGFRFRSGVELVNVTATVSDTSGRFVPGLKADDFLVYEDNQPVEVTHFSAERVPVSLGIALDTSGSMAGRRFRKRRTRWIASYSSCSTSRTSSSFIVSATIRRFCRDGQRIGNC
jgi:hypothetical protein